MYVLKAAPITYLVMFCVLIAVATALLIGSFVLLFRSPQRELQQAKVLSRGGLHSARDNKDGSEQESEYAGRASVPGSMGTLSLGYDCQSEATTERSQIPLSLVPLCPQLVVPDTSNLRVVLPDLACRRRQDVVLNVCSVPALGGRPLFRARIAECERLPVEVCGIYLETLGGEQQFAFVPTEELWVSPAGSTPKLRILRPDGLQFATMKKNHQGDYAIVCGLGTLASFSGDFSTHEAQVISNQGRIMAQVQPGSGGHYEVTTSPSIDAGLIILGLLAIDKSERSAPAA